jgi:hypothetical protein
MQPGSRTDVSCPECGAPAPFRGTTVSLVCEYCSSTIVRTGLDFELLGKVSAILDNGSPIVLGAKATFDKIPFEVVGRLQLRHGRGTWNEWFLSFADNSVGWLSDAQGSYAIVRPREKSIVAGKVPPVLRLRPRQAARRPGRQLRPPSSAAPPPTRAPRAACPSPPPPATASTASTSAATTASS